MSTIEEQLTTSDNESLATELRKLQSASDGEIVYGVVTKVPYKDTVNGEVRVKIEVENPIDSFTALFKEPKPPLGDSPLYRVADEYGQGFADLDALEGEKVPCRYTDGDWEVVVPKSRREKLIGNLFQGHEDTARSLLMITSSILVAPITLYAFPAVVDDDVGDAMFSAVLWNVIWLACVLILING